MPAGKARRAWAADQDEERWPPHTGAGLPCQRCLVTAAVNLEHTSAGVQAAATIIGTALGRLTALGICSMPDVLALLPPASSPILEEQSLACALGKAAVLEYCHLHATVRHLAAGLVLLITTLANNRMQHAQQSKGTWLMHAKLHAVFLNLSVSLACAHHQPGMQQMWVLMLSHCQLPNNQAACLVNSRTNIYSKPGC